MLIVLNDNTPSIIHLSNKSKRLKKLINIIGPISYEIHTNDPYSFMIHEIIEQMLSIKAGAKIYQRFYEICNGIITPNIVAQLSVESIKSTGTSSAKASYIKELTKAVLNGELDFSALSEMDDDEIIKKLTSIKGIGIWTAKMFLIFVLDRQDILPFEDAAFLQSYKWIFNTDDTRKESIIKKSNSWRPYRSIAARYLYYALDMGLTKEVFHLYK